MSNSAIRNPFTTSTMWTWTQSPARSGRRTGICGSPASPAAPTAPLLSLARHMGAPLPADVKLAGTLDGAVSWSGWENLQGQIAFHSAALTFPDSPAVEFDEAKVLFNGDRIHLAQALARTADS